MQTQVRRLRKFWERLPRSWIGPRTSLTSKSGRLVASVAALLVASLISCAHGPQILVFPCVDTPDEVIDDFGPVALEWYRNDYDPYCERIENAIDAGSSL